MSDRKIKITIDPMGNPRVEAEGFVGTSCEAATAAIELALSGGAGGDTDHKPEFYQSEGQSVEQTQGW